MPALVAGIHVLAAVQESKKDVDGRDKPGHDDVVPKAENRASYTRRLRTTAASMKEANSGCGSNGRDLSSGWNWTPMNHG